MMAQPRVLGFLARGLGHELSAVQQYLAQAELAQAWNLPEAAQAFREEASGELKHAQDLVAAMVAAGSVPNATALRPVRVGYGLVDLLLQARAMEVEAVSLYQEAAAYCARIRDERHRALFERLKMDELAHAEELSAWIARLTSPHQRNFSLEGLTQ